MDRSEERGDGPFCSSRLLKLLWEGWTDQKMLLSIAKRRGPTHHSDNANEEQNKKTMCQAAVWLGALPSRVECLSLCPVVLSPLCADVIFAPGGR